MKILTNLIIISITFTQLISLIKADEFLKKFESWDNPGHNKQCPDGQIPTPNDVPITTNGCGCDGSDWISQMLNKLGNEVGKEFKTACNGHDLCYGICSISDAEAKSRCDNAFYKRMHEICVKAHDYQTDFIAYEKCETTANTFFELVNYIGGEAYQKSQDKHCDCI